LDRLRRPILAAAAGIAALGVASLASTLLLAKLPQLFVDAVGSLRTSPGLLVALDFARRTLGLLPATRLWGALFPLVAGPLAVCPLPWPSKALTLGVFREPLRKVGVGIETLPLEGVPPNGLVCYRDGLNATVSGHREGDALQLKINGKTDASVPGDMATQVLLAQVPLLFGAPAAR